VSGVVVVVCTMRRMGPLSMRDSKSQRNAVMERLRAFALVSPCLEPLCSSHVRATVSKRSSSTKSLLNRVVRTPAKNFGCCDELLSARINVL